MYTGAVDYETGTESLNQLICKVSEKLKGRVRNKIISMNQILKFK